MSGGCRALRRGLWPRSFSTALEPAPARNIHIRRHRVSGLKKTAAND